MIGSNLPVRGFSSAGSTVRLFLRLFGGVPPTFLLIPPPCRRPWLSRSEDRAHMGETNSCPSSPCRRATRRDLNSWQAGYHPRFPTTGEGNQPHPTHTTSEWARSGTLAATANHQTSQDGSPLDYDPNDREGQANTHFIAPTPIPNPRPSGSSGDKHRS